MKKETRLTLRERKLIQGLAAGLTTAEAMRAAGYAASTIDKQSKRTVGNSRVQRAISELMDEKGLSDERLLRVLSEGLEAKKVISALIIGKEANERTNDFIEIKDYAVRHKYLEIALKLRGYLRDKVDVDMTVETHEQRMKRLYGVK